MRILGVILLGLGLLAASLGAGVPAGSSVSDVGTAYVTLSGSTSQSTPWRDASEGSRRAERDASARTAGLSMTNRTLAARTLDRDLDPAIATGQDMPAFLNAPLSQLYVYAYAGGAWQQIPWQLDDVQSGVVLTATNGLLDSPDQLVFMAADTGDQAPADSWIADVSAAAYPRYELAVTDPISPTHRGWAYVYRSATLTATVTADYVSYDTAQALMITDRYRFGSIINHPGFDRLELNGSGVDILDRTKIRAELQFLGTQTENDIAADPPALTRDGRVRVVLNGGNILAYRALQAVKLPVDLSVAPVPVLSFRVSNDLSPAASGSRYFDPNTPAGVVVDGSPDTVAASPAARWSQVSGSTGSVVRVVDLSEAGGTASTYYKDDQATDNSDTGDKKSYGDAGVKVQNPAKKFNFRNWNYILPADQPNVGAVVRRVRAQPAAGRGRGAAEPQRADRDADCATATRRHGDAYLYQHAHPDADRHRDGVGDAHPDAFANADLHGDADSRPDLDPDLDQGVSAVDPAPAIGSCLCRPSPSFPTFTATCPRWRRSRLKSEPPRRTRSTCWATWSTAAPGRLRSWTCCPISAGRCCSATMMTRCCSWGPRGWSRATPTGTAMRPCGGRASTWTAAPLDCWSGCPWSWS